MSPAPPSARVWRDNALAFLGRHWAFLFAVAAGAALRVALKVGYPQPFWYTGDSGNYLYSAQYGVPHMARPFGYPMLLVLLRPVEQLGTVVTIQHLAGLGLAVAGYVFLLRQGVSRWVAVLAAVPMLLDGRTVVLEHYLLAETFFTVLLVSATLVATRRQTPGWALCAVVGLLFAVGALTRSVGLAMIALPLLYLILRRVRWYAVVAFAVAAVVPLVGYAVWYHSFTGEYSLGSYSGRFLWSRTATFADCPRLDLTPTESLLCPAEELTARATPDQYLWGSGRPNLGYPERSYDGAFGSFARTAILRQPFDYLRTVVVDTAIFMRPDGRDTDRPGHRAERAECLRRLWEVPRRGDPVRCTPETAVGTFDRYRRGQPVNMTAHRWDDSLHAYTRFAAIPPTLSGLSLLFVLGLMVAGRRRLRWRAALEPLLWVGVGFGMIVGSVATSALDPRYSVPSLPFVVVGAALAWHRFRTGPTPAVVGDEAGADPGPPVVRNPVVDTG